MKKGTRTSRYIPTANLSSLKSRDSTVVYVESRPLIWHCLSASTGSKRLGTALRLKSRPTRRDGLGTTPHGLRRSGAFSWLTVWLGLPGTCWLEVNGQSIQIWDVEATEVHEGLLQYGQWSWKDLASGASSVDNIQAIIRRRRSTEYVRVRDQVWRKNRQCEPYWTLGAPTLLAEIGEFPSRGGGLRGIHKLGKRIRYLWDKNWHGGNRGKEDRQEGNQVGMENCDLCGEVDSQDHWLLRCSGFGAELLREKVDHKLTELSIRAVQEETRWVARFFRTHLFDSDARRLWTSNLTEAIAEDLVAYVYARMASVDSLQIHKGIVRCGRLLLNGGLEVWQLRQ